jgi:cytochrome c
MKKEFIIITSILFLFSCGNNPDTKEKSASAPDSNAAQADDPDAAKGLALVAKSDCFTCHKLTETSIGPAYALVAEKYKKLDEPAMDSMVKQIIKGGAGKWGTVPMTPHPAMPIDDAKLMVHYIMSIKK